MKRNSPMEDEHAPSNKRHKPSQQEWLASSDTLGGSSSWFDILDEPSPLGLRLRKSPSLLDLIERKLSEGRMFVADVTQNKTSISGVKKEKDGAPEKRKASNFQASLLRIGSWEYKPKHQGELMAKFYYAKRKLVWEFLEDGLQNKIEIEWSDITGLKAVCPKKGLSTLTVVVARQPSFFRELNPMPRKNTLWQATSDSTDGQASQHRMHFLQCPQGLLAKHFEKLIQCDKRLHSLSREGDIVLASPYFHTQPSAAFWNPDITKDHDLLHLVNGKRSTSSSFQDIGSPQASLSSSMTLNSLPRDVTSPSSSAVPLNNIVMQCPSTDKSNVFRPSMSTSDLIGQLERCQSEEMICENQTLSTRGSKYKEILEDVTQHLLNDNHQVTATSDEKSLISRVNSLWCLLQKDPVENQNSSHSTAEASSSVSVPGEESKDASGCSMQALGMSRKDSFSDLFCQLPRIESLSNLLFNISDDDDDE